MSHKLDDAIENNFALKINRLSGVSFKCVRVSIPGITLSPAQSTGPFENFPLPGSKPEFDIFTCSFIVDENFANWLAVSEWMLEARSVNEMSELLSDFSVVTPNLHGNEGLGWRYIDAWPTSLDPLDLDSRTSSKTRLIANFNLVYRTYCVEKT